ncbi:chaperone modulator CbpM [Pseudomonas sp. Bout1]|uniref:MerR family transcriptional regulator n=1 Tax=Pseudomonas sp. Bout1 TaxID=3048600 RepID=UPI002AB57DA6|nr:MerR family transcriptional regulator [Pseudomonas sp. Bout1]MDY7533268.1 chaperone modulator CbpM [Pseudomonas sp. Bout1]MEB0183833.1 chaperone modulator CbpM [Pseudomonas sp. Bout1]
MIITKKEFLIRSGLQVQTLEFWIEQEWFFPEQTSLGLSFSDADVARAYLIRELAEKIGANDAGIDVILHLLDQLHGLRYAFEQLQVDMKGKTN